MDKYVFTFYYFLFLDEILSITFNKGIFLIKKLVPVLVVADRNGWI